MKYANFFVFFLFISQKNSNFVAEIRVYMEKNTEIERKFLVCSDRFKSQSVRHYAIKQGYLCKEAGKTIRVRIRDDKAFLTIKSSLLRKGLAKFEWEQEISADDARELLQLCLPGVITKTRYIIPCTQEGRKWEVDVFEGRLAGLVLAEIELGSEDESFEHPEWLGEEGTGQPQYYNANM